MEKFINFITKKEVYGLILVLFLVYIVNTILDLIIDKIILKSKNALDKKKRTTVVHLIKNFKKYALIIIGLIIILDLFGVNVNSLIASLGIASAIGALAMQDTLKDIISGVSIILDNFYVVGDYVKYNNFTGEIIHLGLRSTKIRDFDGQVYTLANRNVTEIINLSQQTASTLIKIPTAYEEKIEKIDKILNEVVDEIKTWDTVDKERTSYVGLLELDSSCINYGIRIYCSPGTVWKYKRDILRLVKIKYDKNKIKIPYNQIEVHNAK